MSTLLRRAWAPALLWVAVIALESTPLGSAENTGEVLGPIVAFLFGKVDFLTFSSIHHCIRKAGHFFGYAVLSLVMFRAWWATLALRAGAADVASWHDMFRRWNPRAALLAILSTAAVAALDEWHQAFLPGRGSSPDDVMLDALAGVFMQLALIAVSDVRGAGKAISD